MNTTPSKQRFVKPEIQVKELTHALYTTSKKLEEANQELLRVQREKDEIFANISHDLRAPITVINNAVENLLSMNQPDQDTLLKTLQIIKRRSEFVHQLVEDIFLLTSLQTNSNLFHTVQIPINDFLEEYYYNITEDSNYSKRKLTFKLPTDYSYIIKTDVTLMHRVLDNLFANALKYTSDDDTICLYAYEGPDSTFIINVIDTGIGIAASKIPFIFKRTYMANSSRTPGKQNGCGLGLAIAESIVKQHNGSITCTSKEGKGSIFSIKLPYITRTKRNLI